jgi:preprotein translocase subunit YajC
VYAVIALFAQEGGGKPAPGPGGDFSPLLLMGLVIAAFYFIVLLPKNRKDKRDRDELFAKLKKNDEVLTASGIIGTVAFIKDDEVVLKVDESSNTRIRVLKSTIQRVLNPKDAAAKSGSDGKAEGSSGGG